MEKNEDFVIQFKNVNTNNRFHMLFNGKDRTMPDAEYKEYVLLFCEYDISLLKPFITLHNKHIKICKSKIFVNNYKIDEFYQSLLDEKWSIQYCCDVIENEYVEMLAKKHHKIDFLNYDVETQISIIDELTLDNNIGLVPISTIECIEYISDNIYFNCGVWDIQFKKIDQSIYRMGIWYTYNYYEKDVDLSVYNRDYKLMQITYF